MDETKPSEADVGNVVEYDPIVTSVRELLEAHRFDPDDDVPDPATIAAVLDAAAALGWRPDAPAVYERQLVLRGSGRTEVHYVADGPNNTRARVVVGKGGAWLHHTWHEAQWFDSFDAAFVAGAEYVGSGGSFEVRQAIMKTVEPE